MDKKHSRQHVSSQLRPVWCPKLSNISCSPEIIENLLFVRKDKVTLDLFESNPFQRANVLEKVTTDDNIDCVYTHTHTHRGYKSY